MSRPVRIGSRTYEGDSYTWNQISTQYSASFNTFMKSTVMVFKTKYFYYLQENQKNQVNHINKVNQKEQESKY